MADLYKGIAGSPITYLAADISANQTTISIADDSALPDAPNIATIGYGEQLETIKYETKSNGVLQNVTRGIEGTPRAWQAGTEVARFFTAYDHNSIIENFNSHLAERAKHRNIYISEEPPTTEDGEEGDIFLSPKQIQTGIFTPVVIVGGVEIPPQHNNQIGKYTVIDNVVFFSMDVWVVEIPSDIEGDVEIGNLPFKSSNSRPHTGVPINDHRRLNFVDDNIVGLFMNIPQNSDVGSLRYCRSEGNYIALTHENFPAETGVLFRFSGFYFID